MLCTFKFSTNAIGYHKVHEQFLPSEQVLQEMGKYVEALYFVYVMKLSSLCQQTEINAD